MLWQLLRTKREDLTGCQRGCPSPMAGLACSQPLVCPQTHPEAASCTNLQDSNENESLITRLLIGNVAQNQTLARRLCRAVRRVSHNTRLRAASNGLIFPVGTGAPPLHLPPRKRRGVRHGSGREGMEPAHPHRTGQGQVEGGKQKGAILKSSPPSCEFTDGPAC